MIFLSAAALAADCDAWLREHERYVPHQPCPVPPKDAQPAFSLLYEPSCSQRVPPRRCAEPVPHGAAEVTPGRAIAPPASAIDWDQFPERVETGVHSERGGSSWEAMIARRKGDCRRCFEFREDSTWWRNYIRNFLAKVLPLPGAEHILDAKQRRGRALTRRRPSSRAGELRRRCRGVCSTPTLRLILLRKQTRVDLRHAAVHAARRQAVLRCIDALVQTRQQRSCTRRHVAELRVVCSALALRVEGTEHAGMI